MILLVSFSTPFSTNVSVEMFFFSPPLFLSFSLSLSSERTIEFDSIHSRKAFNRTNVLLPVELDSSYFKFVNLPFRWRGSPSAAGVENLEWGKVGFERERRNGRSGGRGKKFRSDQIRITRWGDNVIITLLKAELLEMGHDPLAFTFDRTPRSNRRYSCVLHHVFQTCSLPTTVNHGKSVPRFFTLFVTLSPPSLIVSLFLNFERKLRRPLEGERIFSIKFLSF